MGKKYYLTDKMIEELRTLYPHTSSQDLANKFKCPLSSIYYHANKLGVKKSKEFIAETSRLRMCDPNHPGRIYLFKKGHTSFNKGMNMHDYMNGEAIERTKATRFKKGNIPHNHKPIGHERVTVDGYVEVKVRDSEKQKNFELKHRLVWEKHNGKIPKGNNIQFKDGNRLNCKIDNLYMISRAEQVSKENTIHRYPSELKRAIRLTNKLKKQINKGLKS